MLILVIVMVYACDQAPEDDMILIPKPNEFDRAELLTNSADNIIIPALEKLSTELMSLKTVADNFAMDPNQTNLDNLRSSWLSAYTVWQHVEMFNIGLAEEINYSFQMNIYPSNVSDIEANVVSGSYDLEHPNNNDAVGFPAIDYLLYGVASDDASILKKYTRDYVQNL